MHLAELDLPFVDNKLARGTDGLIPASRSRRRRRRAHLDALLSALQVRLSAGRGLVQ
jgi:hypothetical protein